MWSPFFLFFPSISTVRSARRGLMPWRRQAARADPLAVCVAQAYVQVSSHALTGDRHKVGFRFFKIRYCPASPEAWRCWCRRSRSSQTGSLLGGEADRSMSLKTFHIKSLQTTLSHDWCDAFHPAISWLLFGFNAGRFAPSRGLL